MKERSVQSANGTLSDGDKDNLQAEFAELIAQIDDIANRTTFNGVALADGTNATVSIQTGTSAGETVDVTLSDLTAATLAIDALDIGSAGDADAAMTAIDPALDTVTTARETLGAVPDRPAPTVNTQPHRPTTLTEPRSRTEATTL